MSNQYPAPDGQERSVPATGEVTVSNVCEVTGGAPRRPNTDRDGALTTSSGSAYDSPGDGGGAYVGAMFLG